MFVFPSHFISDDWELTSLRLTTFSDFTKHITASLSRLTAAFLCYLQQICIDYYLHFKFATFNSFFLILITMIFIKCFWNDNNVTKEQI